MGVKNRTKSRDGSKEGHDLEQTKLVHVALEFKRHFPFTAFSVCAGLIIIAIFTVLIGISDESKLPDASNDLFHVFHPLHLLFSASATTAMFWRHEKKVVKTIIIGFVGAIMICGLSDIFLPYLGGTLLNVKMELHICLIRHPETVVPFAVLGIFLGFVSADVIEKSTFFSHSAHVFISTMATLMYLTSFGLTHWMHHMFSVFIIVLLGVMIPCCTSDIVFPLLFVEPLERRNDL